MRPIKAARAVAALAVAIFVLAAGAAPAGTRWWDGGTTDIGSNGDGASQGGNGA